MPGPQRYISRIMSKADPTPGGFPASPPWLSRLALAARVGLGLTFAVAGGYKLASLTQFAHIIGDYGLLPKFLHFPAALTLASAEALGGAGLILGLPFCLEIVAGLLALFVGVLIYGMALGLDADCGCFGPSDPETTYHGNMRQAVWRDAAMLALCALLYWQRRQDRRKRGEAANLNHATTPGGNPA
jgi:hypothetical protein